jgi:uncharacterized protein YcbK (DUF882 family)
MIWKMLDYFRETEAWGDPSKMDPFLLFMLDKIRGRLPSGHWIKIHKGFATAGHSPKSQHYHGKAVDFHVVGCDLLDADAHIMRYLHGTGLVDNVGIGIYPQWLNPGFHLDTRGERASWAKIDGQYVSYKIGYEYAKNMRKS